MQNTTIDSSTPSTTLAIQNANVSLPKSPSSNVSNSLADRQSQNPLFQYSPSKTAFINQDPYSTKSHSSSLEDISSTPFDRSLSRYLTPPDSLEKKVSLLDMSGQTLPEITELQSSPSFLKQYHPRESEILPGMESALSFASKQRSDAHSGSSLDGSASSISSMSSDGDDVHISTYYLHVPPRSLTLLVQLLLLVSLRPRRRRMPLQSRMLVVPPSKQSPLPLLQSLPSLPARTSIRRPPHTLILCCKPSCIIVRSSSYNPIQYHQCVHQRSTTSMFRRGTSCNVSTLRHCHQCQDFHQEW